MKPLTDEAHWSQLWSENRSYRAVESDSGKKTYLLIEFPYPSGERLHVGHARSYSCLDAIARKRRMQGENVLFPIGWDAFGLPAENYAVKTGIHPAITTEKNITNAKKQALSWGLSFDWDREIRTTDPKYYRWTQWIFVQLFKAGLAYKEKIAVNWCPSCRINLANEEVIDGNCERCGSKTERRMQSQWLLRITDYAQRLLDDLKTVNFREDIALQQINWIGRSQGINIRYPIWGTDYEVEVFTTRPDTNFGATFIVVAPEHELVAELLAGRFGDVESGVKKKVQAYLDAARNRSERERVAAGREKTGVFSGLFAVNNLNGERLPVWVSDFVLAGVGTGAVVGVPGHDRRDFDFAAAFDLPIKRVVVGSDADVGPITQASQVQEEEGKMINSEFLDGMDIAAATAKIMDYLEEKGRGKRTVSYHLRDWVFSRQHYWGEPIPMVYCAKCAAEGKSWFDLRPQGSRAATQLSGNLKSRLEREEFRVQMAGWYPEKEENLPVELPQVEKYQPTDTGESPLATMTDWVNTKCPECSSAAVRETDTMPNWAGSSWYYLRYCDPKNNKMLADGDKLKYWLPVDWYNGGMEHTTLHLLYSRFWHKVLYDLGVVPTAEPYARRTSHGTILGPDGKKMSKSRGNVINPDEIVVKYGADTLRVYEMFIGPFDQTVTWSESALEGVYRFLRRVKEKAVAVIAAPERKNSARMWSELADLVSKVESDLEEMKFNTAVAALMTFVNFWGENESEMGREGVEVFIKTLAPLAPFLAEDLYQRLQPVSDNFDTIHRKSWPILAAEKRQGKPVVVVVQVQGKVRATLSVNQDQARSEDEMVALAVKEKRVKDHLNRSYRVVFVPGRVVNFVLE